MDKIKILFLSANPIKTSWLKLDEEIRLIDQKIRTSEYRDSLQLVSAWAVRPDDLLQLLNEHKPHIVHFSGHGSKSSEIILVDDSGEPKVVSTKALNSLFKTLKDNVQVVVLNACYSKPQAQAITKVIDCAIGMNSPIGDFAAITFSASFYRALGFGRSIQESFDQGVTALLLQKILEEDIPELLVKDGVDPCTIRLEISPFSRTNLDPETGLDKSYTVNQRFLNKSPSIVEKWMDYWGKVIFQPHIILKENKNTFQITVTEFFVGNILFSYMSAFFTSTGFFAFYYWKTFLQSAKENFVKDILVVSVCFLIYVILSFVSLFFSSVISYISYLIFKSKASFLSHVKAYLHLTALEPISVFSIVLFWLAIGGNFQVQLYIALGIFVLSKIWYIFIGINLMKNIHNLPRKNRWLGFLIGYVPSIIFFNWVLMGFIVIVLSFVFIPDWD